jgi:hypothetical protein
MPPTLLPLRAVPFAIDLSLSILQPLPEDCAAMPQRFMQQYGIINEADVEEGGKHWHNFVQWAKKRSRR